MKRPSLFLSVFCACTAFSQHLSNNTAQAQTVQLFSPYWIAGGGWSSIVELHNTRKDKPLAVKPVLLSPAGQRTELPAVQLGPLGNAALDIGSAIAAGNLGTPAQGSAVFEYSSPSGGALLAETAVTQATRTLAYTIISAEQGGTTSDQHAVFWLASTAAEVYAALQNISASAIHVTAALETSTGRSVFSSLTLGPGASQVVKAPAPRDASSGNDGSYGAIVLTSDGPKGALNTSGWIEDDDTGFSTMMTFYDPGAHHGTSLFATQVFVGKQDELLSSGAPLNIDSYLVLLNTSTTPIVPQAQFVFESGGQISQIPLNVGPLTSGQSASIDIGDLKKSGVVPPNISIGSVMVTYNGPDAALMGRVFGIADNPTYGFYVALESYAAGRINEAFWTTAGDWNSFITVANFANQPDQINVEFTYNGGIVTLPKIALPPLGSVTLNARELTVGRLPSSVTFGGLRISGSSMRTSQILVKEHAISESEKMSTPFYGGPPFVIDFCIADYTNNACLATINVDVGGTFQIFGEVGWTDGEVNVDYGVPYLSYASAASITLSPSYEWLWNVNGQNAGSNVANWPSAYYPYDSYGDTTSFFAQIPVQVNYPCFAILKYRPLKFGIITFPWNHAFWWIQVPGGANYVTEGGPSGDCLTDCGYLVNWVVSGSTGHYLESNPNASTAWQTGLTSAVCNQVGFLLNFAAGWNQTAYFYLPDTQNSNTYAHGAASYAGFSPTQPPSTPGW